MQEFARWGVSIGVAWTNDMSRAKEWGGSRCGLRRPAGIATPSQGQGCDDAKRESASQRKDSRRAPRTKKAAEGETSKGTREARQRAQQGRLRPQAEEKVAAEGGAGKNDRNRKGKKEVAALSPLRIG